MMRSLRGDDSAVMFPSLPGHRLKTSLGGRSTYRRPVVTVRGRPSGCAHPVRSVRWAPDRWGAVAALQGGDMSRVCVVDDDRQVLRLLGRYLSDGGMKVDLLDSGAELLPMVRTRNYDLILLDLGLPDIDGVTLLETLGLE